MILLCSRFKFSKVSFYLWLIFLCSVSYAAKGATGEASTCGTDASPPIGICSLDIDGSGQADALTDGLLLLRGMFGFSGHVLISGALSQESVYVTPEDILLRMEGLGSLIDIDGDGRTDALTDGLLILRYLLGFRGESLVSGALAENAVRKEPGEVESHMSSLILFDSDGDGIADILDFYPLDASKGKSTIWGEAAWRMTEWRPSSNAIKWAETTWSE